MMKHKAFHTQHTPPAQLQGRAAGGKLRTGAYDVTWAEEQCDDTGGRSTIIVRGGINGQLGTLRSDSRNLVLSERSSGKHTAALGPVAKEVENDNGTALRELRVHNSS
eukprot:8456697-Pyramimonas_sp.AAC.1